MASAQVQHAIYHSGEQNMIDYTPSGADVAAGDLISLGTSFAGLWGVALLAIVDGELGALAISGIYKVILKASTAITIGSMVEWDDTNKEASGTEDGDLGLAIAAASSGDDWVLVNLNSNQMAAT